MLLRLGTADDGRSAVDEELDLVTVEGGELRQPLAGQRRAGERGGTSGSSRWATARAYGSANRSRLPPHDIAPELGTAEHPTTTIGIVLSDTTHAMGPWAVAR